MSRAPKIIELNAPSRVGSRDPFFVGAQPIDESACKIDIDDPASAFAQYLLPRLKDSEDEASREVLAFVKSGESLGDAVAFTIQSFPSSKTRRLRTWIEEAYGSRFYPFAKIGVTIHKDTYVGVLLTMGGPRDTVLKKRSIRNWYVDPDAFEFMSWGRLDSIIRSLMELASDVRRGNAPPERLVEAQRDARHVLADGERAVELSMSKSNAHDALAALGFPTSVWKGGGLYDFKKTSPSYLGTVPEYQHDSAFREAQRAIAELYDDADSLKQACESLRAMK